MGVAASVYTGEPGCLEPAGLQEQAPGGRWALDSSLGEWVGRSGQAFQSAQFGGWAPGGLWHWGPRERSPAPALTPLPTAPLSLSLPAHTGEARGTSQGEMHVPACWPRIPGVFAIKASGAGCARVVLGVHGGHRDLPGESKHT